MGDVVTYLLENKGIPLGVLIALFLIWAALHYGLPFLRRRSDDGPPTPPGVRAGDDARIQQTVTGDIRADGDVDISPRQQ